METLNWDDNIEFANFLKSHPDQVVKRGIELWRYDSELDEFLYCKPSNSFKKGWYVARGLKQFYLSQFNGYCEVDD